MKKLFVFLICLSLSSSYKAENASQELSVSQAHLSSINQSFFDSLSVDVAIVRPVKFKRGKAIMFTVLTGIFGGHRIYLGTHQRTPILYSVTLGGLGILPFIDLVNIIFTKDLSKFEAVPQIIMWGR